jgi:hypothetical protein
LIDEIGHFVGTALLSKLNTPPNAPIAAKAMPAHSFSM